MKRIALIFLAFLILSPCAHAITINYGANNNILSIRDIEYSSQFYDIVFSTGDISAVIPSPDYTVNDLVDAWSVSSNIPDPLLTTDTYIGFGQNLSDVIRSEITIDSVPSFGTDSRLRFAMPFIDPSESFISMSWFDLNFAFSHFWPSQDTLLYPGQTLSDTVVAVITPSAPVPEPTTVFLLCTGLLGIIGKRKLSNRNQ